MRVAFEAPNFQATRPDSQSKIGDREFMSNQHRSVESRRFYEQVADNIRALIEAQGLSEGARLPPERELALQLGVSRPSLREALIALEIDGRIEIRSGSGIFVRASSRRTFYTGSLGESPGELLQARVVLESAVATLAAARASKRGLQRVEEALEDMRNGLALGYKPVDADRRFHLGIAELGGNSVLVGMISTLFDGRHSPIASRMSVRVETVHSWEAALTEHEAILRALRSRNPQAAASAMCHHLQTSHGRLIDGPEELSIGAAMV
jgi:DNA-binding FadR family transcriptional regulator